MTPWKKCACCGEEYTEAEWRALELAGVQSGMGEGPNLELRNCECGTTHAMPCTPETERAEIDRAAGRHPTTCLCEPCRASAARFLAGGPMVVHRHEVDFDIETQTWNDDDRHDEFEASSPRLRYHLRERGEGR